VDSAFVVVESSGLLLGFGALTIGIAEILTGLWLLTRGIKTQPVELKARTNLVAARQSE
jgi:hypothetical protein